MSLSSADARAASASAMADSGRPVQASALRRRPGPLAARWPSAEADTLPRLAGLLGQDHPHTLTCAANLALDLKVLGQSQRAEELATDTLGDDHPEVRALRPETGKTWVSRYLCTF